MLNYSTLLSILASAAVVAAVPTTVSSELNDRAGCVFTTAADAIKNKLTCTTITLSGIAVPAGTTLDLTGLNTGTNVIFQGTTTFAHEAWSGPLISVSGKDITVTGAKGNVINGHGELYWDGKGSNNPTTSPKPKFFFAHSLTGASSISNLNMLNSPVQVFSIDSSNGLALNNIHIDNSAGDKGSLGHNTDAFDVGSSQGISITGAVVQNQDDCLAINSGTNITFTGGNCSGGHGLSIGSVGGRTDNVVQTVKISSSTISNSENGVRVKAVSGTTGTIKDVTYQDITLSNISKYGVIVEQNYKNSGAVGPPTAGVPITGLTLNNVHGTMSGGNPLLIVCASCTGWSWIKVAITGGTKSTACVGVPAVVGSC